MNKYDEALIDLLFLNEWILGLNIPDSEAVVQSRKLSRYISTLGELVNRAKPMKPLGISITHEGRCANCPSCNKLVHEQTKDAYNRPLHVCHCGQLIDWSDGK